MSFNYDFFVGIDLGQWLHMASVVDAKGKFLGERGFPHSREGLSETIDWLFQLTTPDTERIAVAIEKPHGAVVELFLDNGVCIKRSSKNSSVIDPSGVTVVRTHTAVNKW